MGAILAALATVTAQWLPNWNRGFARVQRTELLASALERLVADLAAAEFIRAGARPRSRCSTGPSCRVTFVRTALGPNTRPGLEIVRIAEIGSDGARRWCACARPSCRHGRERPSAPRFADPVVLVRAPYRVSFAYAGADRVWQQYLARRRRSCRAPCACTVRDAATERDARGLDRDAGARRAAGRLRARPSGCRMSRACAQPERGKPGRNRREL